MTEDDLCSEDATVGGKPEHEASRRRRETVGGSYLRQAVAELRSSGSSDTLYAAAPMAVGRTAKQRALMEAAAMSVAISRRFEYARSATLYAILAAEAYANQYLQWHLSGQEFDAADKMSTFDKYLLGPRLVRGSALLNRAAQPAQTLRELLHLRTRLVHPKLPTGTQTPADAGPFDDPADYTFFNPRDAARYIVAVAEAAGWLFGNSKPAHFDWTVVLIDKERAVFLEFGEKAAAAIAPPSADGASDLIAEAVVSFRARHDAGRNPWRANRLGDSTTDKL